MEENTSKTNSYKRGCGILFVAVIILFGFGYWFMYGWGPKIKAELPDGGYVFYKQRFLGGCWLPDSEEVLIWIKSNGNRQRFIIQCCYAGAPYIFIKIKDDGKGIWIEDNGVVTASLDLVTGEFRDPWDDEFEWAKPNEGRIIAEGKTDWF